MATIFTRFHEAFPPDEGHEPYNPARHDAFADKLPPQLVHEWREFGFGSYGQGIIWTVSPDEPFLDPDDWPGLDGTGIEVLRNAFGDVYVWQGGRFLYVSVLSGRIGNFSSNPEIVFISMTNADYRKTILLERILRIGNKRFGPLTKDECYGFAPLPALGGAIAEKYLIKTPMREYVAMSAGFLG